MVFLARDDGLAGPRCRSPADAFLLGFSAFLAHVLVGLGAGLVSARRPGGALDRSIGAGTLVLYAAPTFWLGVMAILFLSVVFPVFPPSSSRSIGSENWSVFARIVDRAWHVALPALDLGVGSAAGLARHVRAAMLRSLSEPFCRAANGLNMPKSQGD